MDKHHEYKRDSWALWRAQTRPYTPQEEVEEHRLKKLKLHLKDEMEQIVSEYKLQHAG